jgi:hypothetical protein
MHNKACSCRRFEVGCKRGNMVASADYDMGCAMLLCSLERPTQRLLDEPRSSKTMSVPKRHGCLFAQYLCLSCTTHTASPKLINIRA